MTTLTEIVVSTGQHSEDARIRAFVEAQEPLWTSSPGDWAVLPTDSDGAFGLVSSHVEGERRGREVLRAFVGPALAAQAPTARPWHVADLNLRVVPLNQVAGRTAEVMAALELLVAARLAVTRREIARKPGLADLLRDMRLSLANGDVDGATTAHDAIDNLGLLSRENRRFLEVEFLAETGRWADLVHRPYFPELPRVRRPRQVTEYLLDAVWFGIVLTTGQSAYDSVLSEDVDGRFGSLLRSIDIPQRQGALSLAYLVAVTQGDEGRASRILSTLDAQGRARLEALVPSRQPEPPEQEPDVASMLALGRYGSVVETFLADPRTEWVDSAVEAALELLDAELCVEVLAQVDRLSQTGFLPRPRLARSIAELRELASGRCVDWLDWARRAAGDPWEGAGPAARDGAPSWPIPTGATAVELADLLLVASTGANGDAVAAVLDLLLRLSREALHTPPGRTIGEAVLLILAEQENVSEQVRQAFADLAGAALAEGMDAASYTSLLNATTNLWAKLASPIAFDWALEVLESFAVSPCSVPGLPASLASSIQVRASGWEGRLTESQRMSMRSLTGEVGLPPWPEPSRSEQEISVWTLLNGRTVALYSLVENAGIRLKVQLDRVCSLGGFTHNRDHTETAALVSLAQSADFMIVDTWHAAHQATGAIDRYRPRSDQILPARGSTPALLRALEEWLRRRMPASSQ